MSTRQSFASTYPIRELCRDNPDVPRRLIHVWPESIPALYVQGDWPVDVRSIAIVGTTSPSPAAQSWAYDFAAEAAERGWTVVSGLAHGIDAAAHHGALAVGGRTVAVVADGHDRIFPVDHRPLARRIVREGGSVISISPPGVLGGRPGLLLRNQITSALSRVVVAGQARAWDGAMATLRHAYRQGKIIAALVPVDSSEQVTWRGNDLLLGRRSPWREHIDDWTPAIPIWHLGNAGMFFDELERMPERLDVPPERQETPREIQARLLESIASYRVSSSRVVSVNPHNSIGGTPNDDG